MYFRKKKTPSGQVLQLLESYRNSEGRSRNRVVISLGNAKIDEKDQPEIAKAVEKQLYGYEELLPKEHSAKVQRWVDTIVRRVDLKGRWQPLAKHQNTEKNQEPEAVIDGVLVDGVGHTKTTVLGPQLVGWNVWNKLEMSQCLEQLGFNEAQRKVAAASVINRLTAPVSEHALGCWLESTALPELLGADVLGGGKDRFYRMSDKLLDCQRQIETHLRIQQRRCFALDRTVFLYDLTNTYFEGTCGKNDKARRGKSKHKRNDCPQIVVGMVFDQNGFELAHEVFAGNKNDSTTLVEMIEKLEEVVREEALLFAENKPVVIVDAGVATKKNLALLRKKGFHYLVNDSRQGRGRYRDAFLQESEFEKIPGRKDRACVKVRMMEDGEQEGDRLILCKSEGRRDKETAIRSKAEQRFLDALEGLATRVTKGKLKEKAKIERGIGRILGKHTRVARFYTVALEENEKADKLAACHKVTWQRNDEKYQAEDDLLGCYVLRTDQAGLSAEQLWQLYMTLTRAEDGFRCLKSDLGLRPNRHHTELRADGHVFITVLAYHLLHHVLFSLSRQGDNRNWQSIRRILETHSYTTIILPTKNDGVHRIRKAGIPDEKQKMIYNSLGVNWKNLPVTRLKAKRNSPETL